MRLDNKTIYIDQSVLSIMFEPCIYKPRELDQNLSSKKDIYFGGGGVHALVYPFHDLVYRFHALVYPFHGLSTVVHGRCVFLKKYNYNPDKPWTSHGQTVNT